MNSKDLNFVRTLKPLLLNYKETTDCVNFRCPYCGDSEKNTFKSRGYLFTSTTNSLVYKCHNCGITKSFLHFLGDLDSKLFREYLILTYTNQTYVQTSTPFISEEINLDVVPSIDKLPLDHIAYQYLQNRKVPLKKFPEIYYFEKFKKYTNFFKYTFEFVDVDCDRIVFPIIVNKRIVGFQGRSIDNTKPRYLCIMIDKTAPKIYNIDRIVTNKPVYVFEGIFDCLMVDNSIAMLGADMSEIQQLKDNKQNVVYIFDNEPANKEICAKMKMVIDRGYSIYIWDKQCKFKDFNEGIIAGVNMNKTLRTNVYNGTMAHLHYYTWKNR